MFTFELNQYVEISISGEMGHVNGYQVYYKTADGRVEE